MSLAIQLPPREDQVEFNLRVWERVRADPALARIEGRFETDRHGHLVTTPPPGNQHGGRQFEIGFLLRGLLGGNVRTECPLSTSDGVKGIDVVWFCREDGTMEFHGPGGPLPCSTLCPDFPAAIDP
jgi:hypothetical protein